MKLEKYKIICMIIFLVCIFTIINTNSYAATMQMSINKTLAYVGETFTVTISGINGRVNISGNANISLNKSGSQWVDGSLTITGTTAAVGTGTITVTPVDVTTTAAEPEEVTASASRSITIKEKETTQTKPNTSSNSTTNATKKETTSNAKTEDKSNKTEDFYISKVNLKGIKENGEQVDIVLSPEFNKDIYEYTCNISADIKKLELEKNAGEYTNSVIVTGLEELKEGENTIKLQLSAENHQAKTYTIKVIKNKKEEAEIVEEKQNKNIENTQEQKTTKMISMPLYMFIIMQVLIIVIEIIIIYFIVRRKIYKVKK